MANAEYKFSIVLDSTDLLTLANPVSIAGITVVDEGTAGAKKVTLEADGDPLDAATLSTTTNTVPLCGIPGPVKTLQATALGTGCKVYFRKA